MHLKRRHLESSVLKPMLLWSCSGISSIRIHTYNFVILEPLNFIWRSISYLSLILVSSYLISSDIVFMCICERSYPRKLAFTYLSDLSTEFSTTYPASQTMSTSLRPYAFMEFDTFISRTKATYSDTRATQNLDKLNDELRDVTKVMTKNIEDLLYRGDSLERMGELSSRLRDDSRKYRQAAVRINWELLLKQYGPVGGLAFVMIVFIWWRFF